MAPLRRLAVTLTDRPHQKQDRIYAPAGPQDGKETEEQQKEGSRAHRRTARHKKKRGEKKKGEINRSSSSCGQANSIFVRASSNEEDRPAASGGTAALICGVFACARFYIGGTCLALARGRTTATGPVVLPRRGAQPPTCARRRAAASRHAKLDVTHVVGLSRATRRCRLGRREPARRRGEDARALARLWQAPGPSPVSTSRDARGGTHLARTAHDDGSARSGLARNRDTSNARY